MDERAATLDLNSFQIGPDRGFLPLRDPLTSFHEGRSPELRNLEELGSQIPELLESHQIRPILEGLKVIPPELFQGLSGEEMLHAARIYSFLASAYVHQLNEPKVSRIPRTVAVPFYLLSNRLGRRFPILSYDLYCLNNWRRLDPHGQIVVENMDTIQKFVRIPDEAWFILIHAEIEAKAAPAIRSIGRAQRAVLGDEPEALRDALETIASSLSRMVSTLKRMPEGNSPDVYAFSFRPYIQMFQGVTYEGVPEIRIPPTFRGETGAQSSIIPVIDVALGIKHAKTDLTDYVEDMRNYMPRKHREYIELVESIERAKSLREYVTKNSRTALKDAYNNCLERITQFRQQHLEFAVSYINTKVTETSGTGGTPFMRWLVQLRDETEAAKVS